ncbi:MAG: efflux RND transporter periplasmic adaptor subunit [Paracoccus sp. (in: a-proteobacteria)]|nr:efflux RND transporter periplasmic adaptor subunit [Paracoccus sp. (in: a-proteobacteria)]
MRKIFNSSTLVFVLIVGFLAFWIGGGMMNREPVAAPEPQPLPIVTVAASFSEAVDVTPVVSLYGDVVPNQIALLRSRVSGTVENVDSQGSEVSQGDVLGRISADAREASVARAEAQLRSAERDYEAARQLAQRGVGSDAEQQSRFAQLEAARADLRAAELELANTDLRAPITGTISRVMAEAGSFISAGTEVLEIVDNDPLVARVEVRQSEISHIRLGMPADVEFQGGTEREGRVSFISPIATAQTRTFRVEVEIDNPGREIPAGLSAQIGLSLNSERAHMVSPALVRLDDQGRIGLMAIDDSGEHLQFYPIEIVRARAEAIWVTGLPERVQLVTISQGALSSGQRVVVEETPESYRGVLGGWDGQSARDAAAEMAQSADSEALGAAQAAMGNQSALIDSIPAGDGPGDDQPDDAEADGAEADAADSLAAQPDPGRAGTGG